eukprot:611292-Amphidinium_carterae.1
MTTTSCRTGFQTDMQAARPQSGWTANWRNACSKSMVLPHSDESLVVPPWALTNSRCNHFACATKPSKLCIQGFSAVPTVLLAPDTE